MKLDGREGSSFRRSGVVEVSKSVESFELRSQVAPIDGVGEARRAAEEIGAALDGFGFLGAFEFLQQRGITGKDREEGGIVRPESMFSDRDGSGVERFGSRVAAAVQVEVGESGVEDTHQGVLRAEGGFGERDGFFEQFRGGFQVTACVHDAAEVEVAESSFSVGGAERFFPDVEGAAVEFLRFRETVLKAA